MYRSGIPVRVQATRHHAAVFPSARVSARPGHVPGCRVTSDMVALGENLSPPPTLSAALTPILATSQLTTEKAFSIHRWRPRAGLDEHHPLWKAGVRRLFAAYDLSEADLIIAVAQCRAILSGANATLLHHGRPIWPRPFARRQFSKGPSNGGRRSTPQSSGTSWRPWTWSLRTHLRTYAISRLSTLAFG